MDIVTTFHLLPPQPPLFFPPPFRRDNPVPVEEDIDGPAGHIGPVFRSMDRARESRALVATRAQAEGLQCDLGGPGFCQLARPHLAVAGAERGEDGANVGDELFPWEFEPAPRERRDIFVVFVARVFFYEHPGAAGGALASGFEPAVAGDVRGNGPRLVV